MLSVANPTNETFFSFLDIFTKFRTGKFIEPKASFLLPLFQQIQSFERHNVC